MKHVSIAHDEPLWREIPYADALVACAAMRGRPGLVFLDSAMQHGELGRYSYVACDPFANFAPLAGESGVATLGRVQAFLSRHRLRPIADLPPFQGGLAGYIAYEFGAAARTAAHGARCPRRDCRRCSFSAYDAVVSFDHAAQRAWIVSTGFPETEAPRAHRARPRARAGAERRSSIRSRDAFAGDHVIDGLAIELHARGL